MLSTLKPLLVLLILLLLVPVLAMLQLLPQPLTTPTHPLCVGTIDFTVIRLRSVELPAPGWETSWPAGRCFLPYCWCFWFFSHLPPGPSFICLCFSFPAPASASGSGIWLVTADTCSGSRIIPLCFGSHRFEWPFQLSLVSLPILGVDFLCHHCPLLDVANQRVFCLASPGSPEISLTLCAPSSSSGLCATLLSNPQPSGGLPSLPEAWSHNWPSKVQVSGHCL